MTDNDIMAQMATVMATGYRITIWQGYGYPTGPAYNCRLWRDGIANMTAFAGEGDTVAEAFSQAYARHSDQYRCF